VPRDRFHLTIDSELIDWINDNSDAGGRFRSHGDAVERGWARLEAERTFIVGRCKETSTPFKLLAFRQLYAADLEAGRQGHIEQRLVRYWPHVAIDLKDRMLKEWVKTGLCADLSEVSEVGVRRLKAGSYAVTPVSDEPRLTLPPEQFFALYREALAGLGGG
jgi:hypothetical protein